MDVDAALDRLAADPSAPADVAELALLLARDEYPDLDVSACLARLGDLACQACSYLNGDLEQRVVGLSHFLFDELRFRGNVQDYYDPDNSYLNRVIDRRLGLPITLSVVTMAVAGRAGLTVHGVGLPGHFVVKAVDREHEVIFDPFHGGQVLSPCDCELLVQQVTGQPFVATRECLRPLPPGLLVRRMLTNLKSVYLRRGDFARAARAIGRIRQLCPADSTERRDHGVCLLRAGQPGRAIDLLSEYLDATPHGADADKVGHLLKQARVEVARWN
ncbi:MAG TPA: transglutaminase-like domain-containing protein [Gemmataceae bacterium]|nr:transglutaminase-like domain-containing protein [Gemmataceae bacterium]